MNEIDTARHAADYPIPPAQHRRSVRQRLREQMDRRGLDALVATSAENFYYVAGSPSSLSYLLPLVGSAAIAVLWRDADVDTTVVINDFEGSTFPNAALDCELVTTPHWTGVSENRRTADPPTADVEPPSSLQGAETFRSLVKLLARLPKTARIGVDGEHLQVSTQTVLTEAADGREVIDATSLFNVARAIKTPWEIDKLRVACNVSEEAISTAAALIRPGVTELDLKVRHDGFITSRPIGTGIRLSGISVGATFSIRSFPSIRAALPGELVRFDCGAHLHEYGADIARVFAIGSVGDEARRAYDVLLDAHDALVSAIEPGVETAHLFKLAIAGIRKAGLPDYRRGHLGHSVGLSRAVEEPPLIGPTDSQPLQPGMVLSIETPYYSTEIGAINIEDMLLVTDNGHTVMNRLSKNLTVVS